MGYHQRYEALQTIKLLFFGLLGLTGIIWFVLQLYIAIPAYYQYQREIESYWEIADKSSTIAKKSEYVDKYVAAIEAQHFEGEYNAVLYPTLDNSYEGNMEALKTLQARLKEIQNMDVSSFQYQTAIQQITAQEQGEADKMLSQFRGLWWKRHHFFLWDWVGFLNFLGSVIATVVGVIGFFVVRSDF